MVLKAKVPTMETTHAWRIDPKKKRKEKKKNCDPLNHPKWKTTQREESKEDVNFSL